MTPEKQASMDKLAVKNEVVLDCCNHPVHGVTNCTSLVQLADGFALVDDDGSTIKLSIDQFEMLLEQGGAMLDAIE